MKILPFQVLAISGSFLLMLSGLSRYVSFGSPKELAIGVLYFLANILIFCF